MKCVLCGESDPLKLVISTRFVNEKALSVELCFRCYWREKFLHEDGRMVSEELCGREDDKAAAGSFDPLGLRE